MKNDAPIRRFLEDFPTILQESHHGFQTHDSSHSHGSENLLSPSLQNVLKYVSRHLSDLNLDMHQLLINIQRCLECADIRNLKSKSFALNLSFILASSPLFEKINSKNKNGFVLYIFKLSIEIVDHEIVLELVLAAWKVIFTVIHFHCHVVKDEFAMSCSRIKTLLRNKIRDGNHLVYALVNEVMSESMPNTLKRLSLVEILLSVLTVEENSSKISISHALNLLYTLLERVKKEHPSLVLMMGYSISTFVESILDCFMKNLNSRIISELILCIIDHHLLVYPEMRAHLFKVLDINTLKSPDYEALHRTIYLIALTLSEITDRITENLLVERNGIENEYIDQFLYLLLFHEEKENCSIMTGLDFILYLVRRLDKETSIPSVKNASQSSWKNILYLLEHYLKRVQFLQEKHIGTIFEILNRCDASRISAKKTIVIYFQVLQVMLKRSNVLFKDGYELEKFYLRHLHHFKENPHWATTLKSMCQFIEDFYLMATHMPLFDIFNTITVLQQTTEFISVFLLDFKWETRDTIFELLLKLSNYSWFPIEKILTKDIKALVQFKATSTEESPYVRSTAIQLITSLVLRDVFSKEQMYEIIDQMIGRDCLFYHESCVKKCVLDALIKLLQSRLDCKPWIISKLKTGDVLKRLCNDVDVNVRLSNYQLLSHLIFDSEDPAKLVKKHHRHFVEAWKKSSLHHSWSCSFIKEGEETNSDSELDDVLDIVQHLEHYEGIDTCTIMDCY